MLKNLRESVEDSGNSWPEFVEMYQQELFCILLGVPADNVFDSTMMEDYPGLSISEVIDSGEDDAEDIEDAESQSLDFNEVGTYVFAYYRKRDERKPGELIKGKDLQVAAPNNRKWQYNCLTGTWRVMGNYTTRRRRGLYLKVLS